MRAFWSLSTCLFILQVLDLVSTKLALNHGATEGNQIVKGIVENKWNLVCFLKISITLMAIAAFYNYIHEVPMFTLLMMIVVNLFYIFVIVNNFAIYMAYKHCIFESFINANKQKREQ